jgi:hypothetical protein
VLADLRAHQDHFFKRSFSTGLRQMNDIGPGRDRPPVEEHHTSVWQGAIT